MPPPPGSVAAPQPADAATVEPNQAVLAQRDHTMTVPVDPVRKYCFLVQATDKYQLYSTPPKAIRGAICHQ